MKADANLKAQLQPQPKRQLLPQTQVQPAGKQEEFPPTPVPVKFEGIVVQADPLAVKSVNGDVRTFVPSRQEASAKLKAAWPNSDCRVVTMPDVDAGRGCDATVDIRPGPGSLPRQESSGRTVALIVLTR
jgi:hypothetical protein